MRNAIIASTALMASSALAGTAHVVNSCSYDVYMCNTPAEGGGYTNIDKVLSPGDSYSQDWLELSNTMGWSIKLAKTPSYESDLMQYEYTYHNDGIIWYDMSEVNGNPWDQNWMIKATNGCHPKQAAYRYPTDDAYGMQSCADNTEITLTLCSHDSGAGGDVSSAAPAASSSEAAPAPSSYAETSAAAPSSYAETSSTWATSTYEATSTEAAPTTTGWGWKHHGKKADKIIASPTTLVTSQVSVANEGSYGTTVTNVATEVVTAYVTAARPKRHEHHPRHAHERREE